MKYDVKYIKGENEALFNERESGLTHTPFKLELNIFNSIKDGNIKALDTAIIEYFSYGFIIGDMSDNKIKEIKYWAVSTISLATHYAILGGLDETDAYNLSDEFIRKIDTITDISTCIDYLKDKAYLLTKLVAKSNKYSTIINSCIHYIHIHLHEAITIDQISESLNVSKYYLFKQFKREANDTIHSYIIKEKLKESLKLIDNNISFLEIAYTLGFCSQTHYIKCFKNEYNMTPLQYKNRH